LKSNYYILGFSLDDEELDYEWLEGEGMLGKLTPIREQIMQGDYRALYLSWLKAVSIEDPEEDNPETEPPIPAGMGKLNRVIKLLLNSLNWMGTWSKLPPKPAPSFNLHPLLPWKKRLPSSDEKNVKTTCARC
jgi:hypothetical protein